MIIGKIHPGSGLGDQLFSYIITRVIALDRGFDFGFVGKEYFKGTFMNLDWGKEFICINHVESSTGELIIDRIPYGDWPEFKFDKPYFDPESQFITDNTLLDGYGAQDERYWGHRLDEIREWLKVSPLTLNKENLIINFRGGEYQYVKDLFLPFEYWKEAWNQMDDGLEVEIHTDDPKLARLFWDEPFPIISDIGLNWRSIRYAKHAIISNSAFAIIPRLLKHLEDPEAVTIAPFGWNARNASLTEWKGRPMNYYKKFTYI